MTSPIRTFLEAQQDRLEAIQNSGEAAFRAVFITPGVNVSRLIRNATWPVAMVSNAGGRTHPQNNKLEERFFTLTVATKHEGDHVAEEGETELLDLVELALRGDGTNPGLTFETANAICSEEDGATESVILETGVTLIWQTVRLKYKLQRS